MLRRASLEEVLPGIRVRTATAEDIVVMKTIAGRPRDMDDIERIIATQGAKLNANYIRRWLADLAEFWTEFDLLEVFEQAAAKVKERMKKTRRGRPPREI